MRAMVPQRERANTLNCTIIKQFRLRACNKSNSVRYHSSIQIFRTNNISINPAFALEGTP